MDNKSIGAAKIRQGAAKKVAIKKKVDVKNGSLQELDRGRQIDAQGGRHFASFCHCQ